MRHVKVGVCTIIMGYHFPDFTSLNLKRLIINKYLAIQRMQLKWIFSVKQTIYSKHKETDKSGCSNGQFLLEPIILIPDHFQPPSCLSLLKPEQNSLIFSNCHLKTHFIAIKPTIWMPNQIIRFIQWSGFWVPVFRCWV